jgi:hypothetical protein
LKKKGVKHRWPNGRSNLNEVAGEGLGAEGERAAIDDEAGVGPLLESAELLLRLRRYTSIPVIFRVDYPSHPVHIDPRHYPSRLSSHPLPELNCSYACTRIRALAIIRVITRSIIRVTTGAIIRVMTGAIIRVIAA